MSDKKIVEDREVVAGSDDFKVRRRLLKASAAAPLIATLSPNAALAQVQGSLMCAVKGLDDGQLQGLATTPVSPTDDNAVRIEAICYRHNGGDPDRDVFKVPWNSASYYPTNYYPRPGENLPNNLSSYDTGTACWVIAFFSVDTTNGTAYYSGFYPNYTQGDILADTTGNNCFASLDAVGKIVGWPF